MHATMKQLGLPALLQEACDVNPDPVMTPAETYQRLIREGTEKIKLTEMGGRISAVMLVPYPPGIPIRMPGERLGDANGATIRFLLALEEFGKRFPGFEREVHGIELDPGEIIGSGRSSRHRSEPPSLASPSHRPAHPRESPRNDADRHLRGSIHILVTREE